MNLYNNGFQEDEFTEEEISLANGFCDACDRGVIRSYDEDQYDVIISHLMFSQKADYLKKAIEQARKEFPEDPDFAVWQARYLIWNNQLDEAQQFMQKTLRRFAPSAFLYEEIAYMAYTFKLNLNVRELISKAIAIEPSANAYFILKAREQGFDTLIMGMRDSDALRTLFGIPDNEQVMAVISLGKRASDPRRPDRKPIDEIVKFY